MENANLLTIDRSLMEIAEAVMFENEIAPVLCDHAPLGRSKRSLVSGRSAVSRTGFRCVPLR